jgi:hypothetical protein
MAGERAFGYCVVCDLYGAGVFDRVLTPHSDAIRDHVGCPENRLPRPLAVAWIADPSGQQRASTAT